MPIVVRSMRRRMRLPPLPSVLRLRIGHRLPLHVARAVRAAIGQWRHVVDHVPRSTMGVARLALERALGLLAALDATMAVARGAGGVGRAVMTRGVRRA